MAKVEGIRKIITRTRAVNQPRMLKECQINAMAMCYGPEV